MSYIQLCDIGKIYAGESGIAVGIRSVNLSFDKGEFVAITGQSGSGKSTLLNIISGMDTYEEGEMLIEGQPTSHFIQQDFEEYRKKYISFIFQDYNIIESFTVLQNVELALMHIENRKQRRKKALELLDRVGMREHIRHRGSQLSGGQKQRTVIARALAKDSPVILADEPTGNLDSKTSEEIMKLLHDVSRDKLVLVVTHDFEEVEKYATRHIRIFDGGIEFDHLLTKQNKAPEPPEQTNADAREINEIKNEENNPAFTPKKKSGKEKAAFLIRNGITLGRVRFFSMPKLTCFICFLMILSSIAVTFATGVFKDAMTLFDKKYLFTPTNGRLIVMHSDKSLMSDDELNKLTLRYGADGYEKYDYLYDVRHVVNGADIDRDFAFDRFTCKNYGRPDFGRYPEKENEVLLYLPIYTKEIYNEQSVSGKIFLRFGQNRYWSYGYDNVNGAIYDIVGIKYFYDNTKESAIVLSKDGYEAANALAFFYESVNSSAKILLGANSALTFNTNNIVTSFDVKEDEFYFISTSNEEKIKNLLLNVPQGQELPEVVEISGTYSKFSRDDTMFGFIPDTETLPSEPVLTRLTELKINTEKEGLYSDTQEILYSPFIYFNGTAANDVLLINPTIIKSFVKENFFEKQYYQSSIFFKNDAQAQKAITSLKSEGYQAALSNTVVQPNEYEYIFSIIGPLFAALSWLVAILFIGLLLALCTTRAMQATSGDIAILRTMGIPVPIIKASIYIQTLISIIPAYIATAAFAFVIYVNPSTNKSFTFLHAWQYVLIAVGLVLVVLVISRRYVKKLFKSTVKKTLKGGGLK